MKRLLFIHSVFIHSGSVVSDGITEFRQTRNKREMISEDNETRQITETKHPLDFIGGGRQL